MSGKLKTCPFCGGEGAILSIEYLPDNKRAGVVGCVKCRIGTTVPMYLEDAVKAWNWRAGKYGYIWWAMEWCYNFGKLQIKKVR